MAARLYKCKQIVLSLQYDRGQADPLIKQIREKLTVFGITDWPKAWQAIKKVWASKFNERAFLATKKIGVRLDKVYMAVLIQTIVKAEYAYVVHTTNPTNGEESEVYVEACRGLGEALVSDMPGAALSFTVVKNKAIKDGVKCDKRLKVNSYPNKPIELISNSGFIFRSDSNSEDLPGFAGAGLFDSYALEDETHKRVSYSSDKLVNDTLFREDFMSKVGEIGEVIEDVYDGEPQDIEGAYSTDGKFYVV